MIRSVVIDRSANPLVVGPVIPVEVMTAAQAAGMPIVGKPMRVIRATNADMIAMKYKSVGMRPIPVIVSTENTDIVGGPVQPVYVVSGILDTLEYTNKILALGPIGYWPQAESSGSVSLDESGNSRNGAYTGVTLGNVGIGDGRTAAGFDAATSFNNLFSASLAAAWNGAEGSVMAWGQANNAAWTDGIQRRLFNISVDNNNRVFGGRPVANNQLSFSFIGGGGTRTRTVATSTLAWFVVHVTWSVVGNAFNVYFNGALQGASQTLISGAIVGALSATQVTVGASSTVPANVWSGNGADIAIFNRVLSAAEILSTATVLL